MGRIHVVIEDELLERVDGRVGSRERSRFIADAVRERLERLELEDAARRASGAIRDHRHWRDRARTAEWVREVRSETS